MPPPMRSLQPGPALAAGPVAVALAAIHEHDPRQPTLQQLHLRHAAELKAGAREHLRVLVHAARRVRHSVGRPAGGGADRLGLHRRINDQAELLGGVGDAVRDESSDGP